ncbi:MAG: hypothetical protein GY756_15120 [bacterium]|nr:hypothetical protein [bacterium]
MKKGITVYFCAVLFLLSSSILYANQTNVIIKNQHLLKLHNQKASVDKINSKINFYDTQILNIHSQLLAKLAQTNKNLKANGIDITRDNIPEAAQILKSEQRVSNFYDSQLKTA